jgi:hypothetical protein
MCNQNEWIVREAFLAYDRGDVTRMMDFRPNPGLTCGNSGSGYTAGTPAELTTRRQRAPSVGRQRLPPV